MAMVMLRQRIVMLHVGEGMVMSRQRIVMLRVSKGVSQKVRGLRIIATIPQVQGGAAP